MDSLEERNRMVAEGGHDFDLPDVADEFSDDPGTVNVNMDDGDDDQIFIVVAAPHNRRVTVTVDPVETEATCCGECD